MREVAAIQLSSKENKSGSRFAPMPRIWHGFGIAFREQFGVTLHGKDKIKAPPARDGPGRTSNRNLDTNIAYGYHPI